ncbi:MAG: hypothetical protein HY699_05085 [Deltaproteobacteria bacterium]|nr:hypothetical protein [Deltaproteobacteria bacterium]
MSAQQASAVSAQVLRLPVLGAGVAALGGKGMNLQRLMDCGLPVPAAFVITAAAYQQHAQVPAVSAALALALAAEGEERRRALAAARDAIAGAALAPQLEQQIAAAVAELGAGALAVRSSATGEDAAHHSFAGQHDTFLGVSGTPACCDAVRRCWASLWSERAVAYREGAGLDPRATAMAVVLQRCVAAEVAGVLFTCDPVTGRGDRIVIEAVWGLGESLVSGRVSPDRVLLDKASLAIVERTAGAKSLALTLAADGTREEALSRERAAAVCIDDVLARRLAQLSVRIEAACGAAQDVEWALAGGDIALLQARPVTTVDSTDRQVWSNTNAGELLPDVATPMTFDILRRSVDALLRPIMWRFAIEVGELPILGLIAGRVYFNVTTLAAMLRRLPGVGRRDLVELFGGDREQLIAALPALAAERLPVVKVRWWRMLARLPGTIRWLLRGAGVRGQVVAQVAARTDELVGADLAALADETLLRWLPQTIEDFFAQADEVAHVVVGMACGGYLATVCQCWLGDADGAIAGRLLSGVGGLDSAEAGLELWRLAEAAQVPEVAAALARGEPFAGTRAALGGGAAGQAWLARWDSFMAQHGHHTRGEVDVAIARWREEPDYVLNLVRNYLNNGGGRSPLALHRRQAEDRLALTAECERRLRQPLRRALFRWLLLRAQRGVALRETAKSEAVRRLTLIRTMLLELGRRLAARRLFSTPSDVFFVTFDELSASVRGQSTFEVAAAVARRRAEHADNRRLTPPPVVVGRFDPRRHRAAVAPASAAPGAVLRGIAVSPGLALGPARVILYADTAEHVLPGEILIAPFTDPGWTPYFLSAAGIVMDLGGALSHGSVVAREYGIPAVVNVGTATRIIRTGQLVRVDGLRGEVTVLDPEVPGGSEPTDDRTPTP